VGVISFPKWPVYCHVRDGQNVIRLWLDQSGVSTAMRYALQNQIDLVQYGGPAVVPGCIVNVGAEFEAFKGVRKGERSVYLVFRRGVFAEQEITLLTGTFAPRTCLDEARQYLREIERDRNGRRKYERITRSAARGI